MQQKIKTFSGFNRSVQFLERKKLFDLECQCHMDGCWFNNCD